MNTIHLNPFPRAVELSEAEDHALKMFAKGEADAEQQKLAFDTILKKLCRIGCNTHGPDGHESAFNAGMQAVGHSLIQIIAQSFKEV